MYKKIIFTAVGVALLAAPFAASAVSISDLQAQVASLLSRIQSLQLQATSSASVSASAPSVSAAACPIFARSLAVGSTGSDVTSLQQFLSSQGFLTVSATGYFGALTKSALANWQMQNGVAASGNAGLGIFGPLSRAAFVRWCGGNTSSQSLSAVPQSGPAPLTVAFTTSDSITASSTTYSIDFGDGASADMTKGSCVAITAIVGGQGGIRCSYNVSHTYALSGTYVAKLMKNTCPAGAECFVGPLQVASTVVTVGSNNTSSLNFTASPQSGNAPLTVQFTSVAPMGANLGTSVNFGDGSSANLLVAPTCAGCNEQGSVSHTYTAPGTYTATLTGGACACPANGICNCPNMAILGTATVTVGPSSSTNPSNTIVQLNAPGSVTLQQNWIAEVRNQNYYFTLQSLSNSSATIQLTPVGCWNSFPSDTPPQIRCMIAVLPIPPQTLSIGQSYVSGNYNIALTSIQNGSATFSIGATANVTTVSSY